MKTHTLKVSLFCAGLLFTGHAFAQDDLDQLLKENVADSKILIGEYVSPFMKSVSLGLNQGWYNTAKTHKKFGVDLTITVSAMTIPNDQLTFDVTKLNLQQVGLHPDSPTYPYAPTIFGPGGEESEPVYYSGDMDETFTGPSGIDLKEEIGRAVMPVPVAHLGFGLPFNTEIKVRFVPTLDIGDDGEFKLWGVGVMHDIKQHIPGIKLLPFDLSAFVGHTRLSLTYIPEIEDRSVAGENQRSEFNVNATTVQALISKKFSVLTLYGGLGYNIAKSNIALKGTYDLDEDGTAGNGEFERDPIDLKFAANGFRATAGFRLKLAVLTLHADYTLQKYKAISAGIGISVR